MTSSPAHKGLHLYAQIFSGHSRVVGAVLDRNSLPAPSQYLTQRGLLLRPTRGEWVAIKCPVHKDGAEDHPSLRINLSDGHFRCHACGVKGGDIVALHRLITGKGFADAVHDLGGRFHV